MYCYSTVSIQLKILFSFRKTRISKFLLEIQGGSKLAHTFLYSLTLPNTNRFSRLLHCQNQEKICNIAIAKDPTTPQACRYTTLWNVSETILKIG